MTRRRTRLLALVLGAGLLAGGCSSDDGGAAPTTTAPGPTTTTAPAGPTGDGPSPAQLAAVLPTLADVGDGWVQVDDDATSEALSTDRALADQCPALARVLEARPTAADGDADRVARRFVDGDGRELVVALDPTPPMLTDDALRDAVDATNRCPEVVSEDRDGVRATVRLQAAVDPDHGEQALKFQGAVAVQLPSEDEPISLNQYGLAFRTGAVAVRITATDGIDPESLDVNRTDVDLLASLSDRLEASVDDLAG